MRALLDTLRFHPHLMQSFPLFSILGNAVAYRHGSTKLALGPLLQAHRLRHSEPMAPLMIGVCYLRLVMSRGNANRHYVALQAFAFLAEYVRLRLGGAAGSGGQRPWEEAWAAQQGAGVEVLSETLYNLGRAFHQLGLADEAQSYYQRCLRLRDEQLALRADGAGDATPAAAPASSQVYCEAAYNLSLILRKCNPRGATQKLMQYVDV